MSNGTCPYEVGPPRDWLAQAGLAADRKACAMPIGPNCGMNNQIIGECCTGAAARANTTGTTFTYAASNYTVCALPQGASNASFEYYQDCILNYRGRDGGFRCNAVNATNANRNCNSLHSAQSVPVNVPVGSQLCGTAAIANASSLMQSCCGSAAVAYEGGCFMYCVGPSNKTIASCIIQGLTAQNLTTGAVVGCQEGTITANHASRSNNISLGSTLGLLAVLAWALGLC